ncbi:Suf-domain-containing protein [Auriscalpium vulgare]|uniref:Suf-domain-containing protein n=1 Tax=Auriscalpium vulgare TaxID=40419 RepID=A0ACB8S904_9AGAM|nr:Suf-domain-containing protein [Auriscalpium vulgare]
MDSASAIATLDQVQNVSESPADNAQNLADAPTDTPSRESHELPQENIALLHREDPPRPATPPIDTNGAVVKPEQRSVELPTSEWDQQLKSLQTQPHDPDGWNKYVRLAEESDDLEKIKETYEALLRMYPNSAAAQIAYLNHFLIPGYFTFAEDLFKRFLRTSPAVELWRFYLTYVRRINLDPSTRDIVRKAYEYALNHVGQDKDSSDIWIDYIQFLRSGETGSTWEEQQKMDALRKVYHRAVQIPLENVETLWQELEAFENGLNRITAKKFMNDLSPSYMQARTVLRQLQRHLGPLFPPASPSNATRPSFHFPPLPTFNSAERTLVGAWKNYLRWEESNPLEIEDKDKATFISRVQGVYRKAVIRMRFFGEIWYMAYVWTNSIGKSEEAINILKAGIEANPTSFLLNFAYAEVLEVAQKHEEAHAVFEKFLDALRIDLEKIENTISPTGGQDSSDAAPEIPNNSSFATQPDDTKPPRTKELADKRREYGLAWTMYMRFARRAEGLKASRALFARARRDRWNPWEVYESAAIAEYHLTKNADIATRIFEKGLEVHGDEVEFVSHYLGFLLSVNDENNARALFERMISSFSPERARPLWERWARHEYQYGDLAAAQKLEKRMAEAYPGDPPIKRFAQRHTYHSIDAIASRDLGVAMARQSSGSGSSHGSSSSLGRTDTQQSFGSTIITPTGSQQLPISSQKRASSPDHKRRDDSYGPASYKRARPSTPPPRDRWEGANHGRRRYGSPSWEKDKEKDSPVGIRRVKDVEDEKPVSLPSVISWFVGQLPTPGSFDGPVFRTDDLMQVFRNAVIPSVTGRARSPPPPPPRAGGRPPPDYGPYQGPGSGRRRY